MNWDTLAASLLVLAAAAAWLYRTFGRRGGCDQCATLPCSTATKPTCQRGAESRSRRPAASLALARHSSRRPGV